MMWVVTLVMVTLLYESTKYLLRLAMAGRLRWRMGVLAVASVYPHYYGWWATWNYLNDDFYSQVCHQALFTVTEMLSTVLVLHLADAHIHTDPKLLMAIVGIAGGHVSLACWDQFVGNVLLSEGFLHQVLRDLGMMLPDLLHMAMPVLQLREYAAARGQKNMWLLISDKLAATTLGISAGIWILGLLIS